MTYLIDTVKETGPETLEVKRSDGKIVSGMTYSKFGDRFCQTKKFRDMWKYIKKKQSKNWKDKDEEYEMYLVVLENSIKKCLGKDIPVLVYKDTRYILEVEDKLNSPTV